MTQQVECCLHIPPIQASGQLNASNKMMVMSREQATAIHQRCLDWVSKPSSDDEQCSRGQVIAEQFLMLWEEGANEFKFEKDCKRKFMEE